MVASARLASDGTAGTPAAEAPRDCLVAGSRVGGSGTGRCAKGGAASGAWNVAAAVSASDDELTLDLSMRTPAATSRAGPHAALSGLTQRAASAFVGTVRHLAGGAATADSPDSFVGVEVDGHDCAKRGMRTRSRPPEPPAGSSDAAEGPSSGSELDLPELGRPSVTRSPLTPSLTPASEAASTDR